MTRNEYRSGGAIRVAKRGTQLPHAKLDEAKVDAIRVNRHGRTAAQLAAEHGVHIRTIEKIRHWQTWRHV